MNITEIVVKYLVLSSRTDMGLGRDRNNKLLEGLFMRRIFWIDILGGFSFLGWNFQRDVSFHFASNAKAFADHTSVNEVNHEKQVT